MDATPMERRKMVTIPQEEFEAMLERAAERGARAALHGVGLDGEDAAHDIRELRNLLDAFNEAVIFRRRLHQLIGRNGCCAASS